MARGQIHQPKSTVRSNSNKAWRSGSVPRRRCSEEVLQDVGVAERVFGPAIDHLANAYQVPCITDVEYSDELSDVSDVHCEQRGFRLDGWQPKERQALRIIRVRTFANVFVHLKERLYWVRRNFFV